MGCDIHLFAEGLNPVTKAWEYLPAPDAEICDPSYRDWNPDWPGLKPWFEDRNYPLFGMLAGVRTHQYAPVAQPRGIPSDVSPEIYSQWIEFGEHTPSWLGLKELLAYFDPMHRTYQSRFRDFLIELGTYGTPETLRIVFWYDS